MLITISGFIFILSVVHLIAGLTAPVVITVAICSVLMHLIFYKE